MPIMTRAVPGRVKKGQVNWPAVRVLLKDVYPNVEFVIGGIVAGLPMTMGWKLIPPQDGANAAIELYCWFPVGPAGSGRRKINSADSWAMAIPGLDRARFIEPTEQELEVLGKTVLRLVNNFPNLRIRKAGWKGRDNLVEAGIYLYKILPKPMPTFPS